MTDLYKPYHVLVDEIEKTAAANIEHALRWTPGGYGKGVVDDHTGAVHTWNVTLGGPRAKPTHDEYYDAAGVVRPSISFHIRPDGGTDLTDPEDVMYVRGADSRHFGAEDWTPMEGPKLAAAPDNGTYDNPDVMYHLAPQAARESILQHGLDHARGRSGTDYGAVGNSPGNYLWANLDDALYSHETHEENLGTPWDIWRVNTSNLPLERDPYWESNPDGVEPQAEAHFTAHPIGPERLQLHSQRQASLAMVAAPQTSYHLTDNPQFTLDPEYEPTDNTFALQDRSGRKGLYTTSNPESWYNGHDYVRPFVAEIEHPPAEEGRWGGEGFLPAEHFGQSTVKRVIPYSGWEGEHFDNKPYGGPDAREMTPEQVQVHRDYTDQHIRDARPHMISYEGTCPKCHESGEIVGSGRDSYTCKMCGHWFKPEQPLPPMDPRFASGAVPDKRDYGELRRSGSLNDHDPAHWDESADYDHRTDPTVGLVPTSRLLPLREYIDRDEAERYPAIKADVAARGFQYPVEVYHSPAQGVSYLGDGNNRVTAAHELGISHVPTTVSTWDNLVGYGDEQGRQRLVEPGHDAQRQEFIHDSEHDYVHPSRLGLTDELQGSITSHHKRSYGDSTRLAMADDLTFKREGPFSPAADDYESGEGDAYVLKAHRAGQPVGELHYNHIPDAQNLHVTWTEVPEELRRQGVGRSLIEEMHRLHPQHSMDTSGLTDDGRDFWNTVTSARGDQWQQGLCDTYALALMHQHPHLRLGILGSQEGDDPGDWVPFHYFAHDDTHAYDSAGKHPLPYRGLADQADHSYLDESPEEEFGKDSRGQNLGMDPDREWEEALQHVRTRTDISPQGSVTSHHNERYGNSGVMYHVAPQHLRETIQTEGLRPNAPEWGDMPSGAYLWPSLEHAQQWSAVDPYDRWPDGKDQGPDDIWQVDTQGLPLEDDTHTPPAYYSPSHVPPERLSMIPPRQAALGSEHMGAATRTQLLEQATGLPGDQSGIAHEWPDGWTVRQLGTYGDLHREGSLMSNCWRYNAPHHDRHTVWSEHPEWQIRGPDNPDWDPSRFRPTDFSAPLPYMRDVGFYSLRDPDNVPHASFNADGDNVLSALGRHNSELKPEYVDRLRGWADTVGVDTPDFRREASIVPDNRYYGELGREAMAADPVWWHQFTQGQPLYHGTSQENAAKIQSTGLLPWDHPQNASGGQQDAPTFEPRPDHVYLSFDPEVAHKAAMRHANPAVVKVDPDFLNPDHVSPDEDWFVEGMHGNPNWSEDWDGLVKKVDPEWRDGKGVTNTPSFKSWGDLAERAGLGDDPKHIEYALHGKNDKGFSNGGSKNIAHRGAISPYAITPLQYDAERDDWFDPPMAHQANILDEIHQDLDPLVFDDPSSDEPTVKHQHRQFIFDKIYSTLKKHGYEKPEGWLSLILTGSLTTYQYGPGSDVDISLFVNHALMPDWSRAEMIGIMVSDVDGTELPGTHYPLQCFVVAPEIDKHQLYQPGLRSGYDLISEEWVVPPERDRSRPADEQYKVIGLLAADKMERLLRYEPQKAGMYWHQIHGRRRKDQMAGKGDYCLAPGTRVLTADYSWRPIGDLVVGDQLIGFDEDVECRSKDGSARGQQRTFATSEVTHHERKVLPSYRVTTDKAAPVVASAQHLWLVRGPKRTVVWKTTAALVVDDRIIWFGAPWGDAASATAAYYLAGLMDGEGHITKLGRLCFTQKTGLVLDRCCEVLDALDFEYGIHRPADKTARYDLAAHLQVCGGVADTMRFLHQVPTVRLRAQRPEFYVGRQISPKGRNVDEEQCLATVRRVEAVGDHEVIAMATSTKTFIAEGLYTHNSESNVIYKTLANRGLFPQLEEATGEHIAKTADYDGWTNGDTMHTKMMMDNTREWYEAQKTMGQEGWTPDQIRDWALKHVIGPHNKQQIADAQEWNEIPEHDRLDHHYEEFKDKHGDNPRAMDLHHDFIGGPDVSDEEPRLIDPELTNWHEIHQNIMNEHAPAPHPEQPFTLPADWTVSRMSHDYQTGHRPSGADFGAPMHALDQIVDGVYENPQWYMHNDRKYDQESWKQIAAVRGNPDAMVTIHRATPGGVINPGDWVTPSHSYAAHHGMHYEDPAQDLPVVSQQVPAKHLYWSADDMNEFGYWPDESSTLRKSHAQEDRQAQDAQVLHRQAHRYARPEGAEGDG